MLLWLTGMMQEAGSVSQFVSLHDFNSLKAGSIAGYVQAFKSITPSSAAYRGIKYTKRSNKQTQIFYKSSIKMF